MFVFSVRANKPKIIFAAIALLISLSVVFFLVSSNDNPVGNDSEISSKASNEEERIAFLSQFGWEINEDPIEVSEVIIPSEFNDTYSAYNELQKKQSMDLVPYKGQRVKKWVYEVKNYPDYPAESGCIRATMLIYEGMVIGGDVSSIELDGFMQGFDFPDAELNATTAATTN